MDVLDGVPKHLLGYKINTRTQILFSILIPTCLELLAYLIQTVSDIALSVQHFRDKNSLYGSVTFGLVCLPAIICFIFVMTSRHYWPQTEGCCHNENIKFISIQIFNLILFPIGAIIRFSWRIFWSIESLFHNEDTYERHDSVTKAAETSPFELYHFVQAYTQAAPQIILQLFILLRGTTFRNYETSSVQVLTIIFSLINMAVITMSYQRFESQKIVGRNYPWEAIDQVENRRRKFARTRSYIEEIREKRKQRNLSSTKFPETEHILKRFHSQQQNPEDEDNNESSDSGSFLNEIDDKIKSGSKLKVEINEKENDLNVKNVTDDEKLNNSQNGCSTNDVNSKSLKGHDELDGRKQRGPEIVDDWNAIEIIPDGTNLDNNIKVQNMDFDNIPQIPPPQPPNSPQEEDVPDLRTLKIEQDKIDKGKQQDEQRKSQHHNFNPLNRLSTFKDMLVLNAEIYIKENLPHPPRIFVDHIINKEEHETPFINRKNSVHLKRSDTNDVKLETDSKKLSGTPNQRLSARMSKEFMQSYKTNTVDGNNDELDFFLPTRKKIIQGVEQDDFVGKFISFFGWIMFIFMRMMSLSTLAVFYPWEFIYIVCAHYCFMLLSLIYETGLDEKLKRILFYVFLAYIYIFVILEFKIKFKRLRLWFIGYFLLVLLENFLMTIIWYQFAEYESWWYEYFFITILFSGVMCLACMFVYFCLLKPNDVILLSDS